MRLKQVRRILGPEITDFFTSHLGIVTLCLSIFQKWQMKNAPLQRVWNIAAVLSRESACAILWPQLVKNCTGYRSGYRKKLLRIDAPSAHWAQSILYVQPFDYKSRPVVSSRLRSACSQCYKAPWMKRKFGVRAFSFIEPSDCLRTVSTLWSRKTIQDRQLETLHLWSRQFDTKTLIKLLKISFLAAASWCSATGHYRSRWCSRNAAFV